MNVVREVKEEYNTETGVIEKKFIGFTPPEENWSKLPHEFIEAMPIITSLAEMKVILYVLRHTWGFQDSDKKITVDEFMNGRRQKDKETGEIKRLDDGTGLSEQSVRNGIESAIEHGFLRVDIDSRDLARIKKYYYLGMVGGKKLDPKSMKKRSKSQGSKSYTSGVKDLDLRTQEVIPRTEKETIERNSGKNGAPVGELTSGEIWESLPSAKDAPIRDTGLIPILPEESYLFEALNTERTARNRPEFLRFKTTKQRAKFRECVSFFNGSTNQQVNEIIANGKTDIEGVVNALHWRLRENKKTMNNNLQGLPLRPAPIPTLAPFPEGVERVAPISIFANAGK